MLTAAMESLSVSLNSSFPDWEVSSSTEISLLALESSWASIRTRLRFQTFGSDDDSLDGSLTTAHINWRTLFPVAMFDLDGVEELELVLSDSFALLSDELSYLSSIIRKHWFLYWREGAKQPLGDWLPADFGGFRKLPFHWFTKKGANMHKDHFRRRFCWLANADWRWYSEEKHIPIEHVFPTPWHRLIWTFWTKEIYKQLSAHYFDYHEGKKHPKKWKTSEESLGNKRSR